MLAWHLSRLAFFSHHATFPSKACRFVLLVAFDRNIGSACCWRTGAAVLDISALQAISVDRELVIQRFVCYADVLRSFVAVLCKTHQWFFFCGGAGGRDAVQRLEEAQAAMCDDACTHVMLL